MTFDSYEKRNHIILSPNVRNIGCHSLKELPNRTRKISSFVTDSGGSLNLQKSSPQVNNIFRTLCHISLRASCGGFSNFARKWVCLLILVNHLNIFASPRSLYLLFITGDLSPFDFFRQETSNADAVVRTEAMSKIAVIVSLMGPERTRNEMLPYLQSKHCYILCG